MNRNRLPKRKDSSRYIYWKIMDLCVPSLFMPSMRWDLRVESTFILSLIKAKKLYFVPAVYVFFYLLLFLFFWVLFCQLYGEMDEACWFFWIFFVMNQSCTQPNRQPSIQTHARVQGKNMRINPFFFFFWEKKHENELGVYLESSYFVEAKNFLLKVL